MMDNFRFFDKKTINIFTKLEDFYYRVVIEYFHLKCFTPYQIKDEMENTLEDSFTIIFIG